MKAAKCSFNLNQQSTPHHSSTIPLQKKSTMLQNLQLENSTLNIIPTRKPRPLFRFSAEVRAQLLEGIEDPDIALPSPRHPTSQPIPTIKIVSPESEAKVGSQSKHILDKNLLYPHTPHLRPRTKRVLARLKDKYKGRGPWEPPVAFLNAAAQKAKKEKEKEKQWCCIICLQSFGCEGSLQGHLGDSECASRVHRCGMCKKMFKSEWGLEQHANTRIHDGL